MAPESPSEAEVMSWFETLSNWGRWGDDDLMGTLNLITPEKRAQAAGLVSEGTQVSCAWTITYARDADAVSPPRHFMLSAGDVEVPDDQLGRTNALDAFLISPHGFTVTHLDAPSHTFWRSREGEQRTMFNGVPANRVRVRDGATEGSVELAGDGIVSRGVLLDIPRLRGADWLEPGTAIAPEELEAAEAAQGVRVEPGDVLFIRTGYPRLRDELGPQPFASGHPGPDARCVPWVRERDVALLGCDVANDVRPLEFPLIGGPFHGIGMGAIGLWLLDNCNHEALAEECARLERWEFLVTIAALKLQNGTGSPVNPIALF
ncbi:MAG TPA: cyclase family protein [Dehalococcoidia bacterium]|jgi:kynurenine formamidase|nr:cyclase family protein [Dehalococcoidia bacterium]